MELITEINGVKVLTRTIRNHFGNVYSAFTVELSKNTRYTHKRKTEVNGINLILFIEYHDKNYNTKHKIISDDNLVETLKLISEDNDAAFFVLENVLTCLKEEVDISEFVAAIDRARDSIANSEVE